MNVKNKSLEELFYIGKDESGNEWEIGIKEKGKYPRPSAYIKINDVEIRLNTFYTKSSALQWWGGISSTLTKKSK